MCMGGSTDCLFCVEEWGNFTPSNTKKFIAIPRGSARNPKLLVTSQLFATPKHPSTTTKSSHIIGVVECGINPGLLRGRRSKHGEAHRVVGTYVLVGLWCAFGGDIHGC